MLGVEHVSPFCPSKILELGHFLTCFQLLQLHAIWLVFKTIHNTKLNISEKKNIKFYIPIGKHLIVHS